MDITEYGMLRKSLENYSDDKFDSITTDMDYKGSVATVDDLPSGASQGDVYTIASSGARYVYDGTNWVEIEPVASQLQAIKEEGQKQLQDINDEVADIRISSDANVNMFFKELLLINVNASDIKKFTVNLISGYATFIFKDASGNNIVSFSTSTSVGSTFSCVPVDNKYLYAYVDWTKVNSLPVDVVSITFSEKINDIHYCPQIRKFITNNSESVSIPTFTKTSSYRINTSGQIVSAGSSWFYTNPIQVKTGDILYLRSTGNNNVAPICLTDSTGSYYTPAVVYGGSDPWEYHLPITKDGYVAISGYTDNNFRVSLYRNTYVQAIVSPFNNNLSSLDTRVTKLEDEQILLPLNAIDYNIKIPASSGKIDVKSLANWHTDNGATLALSEKYDNISRTKKKCVSVTSNSGDGFAYCELGTSVNANTHPLMVSVCLGDYDDIEHNPAGNFHIEMYSGSTRNSSYKVSLVIQGETSDASYNATYNRNGWFDFCIFVPSVDSSKFSIIGDYFDPTDIRAVGVRVYNSNSIPNVVHVAEMSFLPAMQKPGIVTIIDNFNTSVPAMADYAYSKGVRLNLSIIPGFYAGASGAPICASKEELDRIASQGHCIWNHTWTHQTWNTLTNAQIQNEINLAETWMKINGFGDDSRFISVPSAKFPTYACNSALETNAQMIFHDWVRDKRNVFVPYYPALRCLPTTLLDSQATYESMSGADMATVAEKCMTYGGITVMGFHGTYWELDDGVSWKAYIDAISEIEGVYHYGLDEIYGGQWC